MSSVMGRFVWPGRGPYVITKHAIEALTDTLRMEMKKFGVYVVLIEPGAFGHATRITGPENVRYRLYITMKF